MKTLYTTYNNFAKRLVMLLIILITIGIGRAWGEDYELVTTITDGEYVIGAVKGSAGNNTTIYAINSTDGTSWKSATEKTPSNGKISNPASSIVWTLTKTGDNSFTLKNGSIYLTIATTTGSGSVRSNSTSPGTIYFASTGSNSTFEISGVSTFSVSSENQVGYNIGSGYRQYANRAHSTSTNSGSISTQFRFYKRTASTFTVTCQSNNSSYGTVSQPSVTNVANNTSISAEGNILTVGTTLVEATPKAQDANYNYEFTGWTGIPSGNKVTANCTITANFTRTERTLTNYRTSCVTETRVSLNADGGTIEETRWNKQNDIYTQSFTASDQITLPTPTKAGNRFDGWYDENKNIVESPYTVPATDITLTAKWTAYTVNWTITPAEGGTLSSTIGNTTSVDLDSEYEYESPAYTVTSGAAEVTQNNNTFTAVPTSNCTIQINLKLKPRYTVALKDDDTELHQASFGASVELPSRESCKGYTFEGWTKTWSEQQDEWTDVAPDIIPAGDYTPTGNEELYPVYSKVEDGDTKFNRYEKVTADLVDWSGKYLISNGTSTATGQKFSETALAIINFTPGKTENKNYEFTIVKNGNTENYYIVSPDNTFYVGGAASGTNLSFSGSPTNDNFLWNLKTSDPMTTNVVSNRYIGVGSESSTTVFKQYSTGGSNAKCYLYKRIEEEASVTYYISVPNCCTPLATVNGKVQISNISETSATASWSWSSATTGISKNILKVYESNGALVKTIDGITPSATSQNITDLTTCTEYYATLTTVRSNESYCEGIEQGKSVNFTTEAWNVTASLTNTSRLTGTDVACSSSDYVATFEAAADYALPETIIVEIGDEEKTAGSDYNWDKATGTLTIDASVIHGDINIFIVAECIVTFNMNGHGVVPAPQIIEENGTVTEPSPAPKAEGYDFGGWFTDSECTSPYDFSSPVTASFTLYAKWTAIEYTITYGNLNGVNNDANPKTYTIESETITLKNLDDTNTHHFVGWYDEDDNLVTKIPQGSTGDITLYAKWVEIFSVKWYANGKELTNGELGSASTIVYEGEHISNLPPSGNLNNYCGDFVGWTDAEMDVNNVAKPNNLYTQASEFPNATGNQEFFAVFAE